MTSKKRMETRTGCTDGTDKETRCRCDLVCAYSDYGPIGAQHNLQSGMVYVSSRFESIYYFGA